MGKLVLIVACIGLFTLLLSSTAHGDEQNKSVEKSLERELREAGDKPRRVAKKNGKKHRNSKKNNKNPRKKNQKKKNGKPRTKTAKKNGKPRTKTAKKNGKPRTKTAKKNGKPRSKTAKKGCSRQTTSTFCPTEKATAMKLLYNQVYNFKKQLKRAENHAKIVKKKQAKKDAFQNAAAIVTDVVGGNLTAPTCAATARSSANAASTGTTLSGCSATIASSCGEITINSNLTGTCSTTMTTYEAKVTECKADDSCTCWTAAFAMKSDITKCNALDEANRVKALKKTCLKTFGDCKKAQDSAVEYTATCPTVTSTATTKPTMMTTKSSKRKSLVEKFLARNLMKRDTHIVKA
eukprot:GFUD01079804.1.p1 GENE.GFUD01079804.1~~GFUD01079804.1.p1  ORF type:complete len:350 (+),score=119.04 GFUD01079804.1:69-1118(+)